MPATPAITPSITPAITWNQLAELIHADIFFPQSNSHIIPYQGLSIDTRTIQENQAFCCIQGPNFDGHDFALTAFEKKASLLITEKKLELNIPQLITSNTTETLGKLAQQYRLLFNIPVLALTGSCGKTGTKEMMSAICQSIGKTLSTQGNLNNQFGLPLTLFQLDHSYQFAVLELGASRTGDIKNLVNIAQPTLSLITNIRYQHAEGMGDTQSISQEKSEIFNLSPNTTYPPIALLNLDESFSSQWLKKLEKLTHIQILTFGLNHLNKLNKKPNITAQDILTTPTHTEFLLITPAPNSPIKISIPLLGPHVIHNALAACAAGFALKIPLEKIKTSLENLKPIPGRLCPHVLNHFTVIDDTYNASPAAVKSAIECLTQYPTHHQKIFIMSNMAQLADQAIAYHRQMGEWLLEAFNQDQLDHVLLYGSPDLLIHTVQATHGRAKLFQSKTDLETFLYTLLKAPLKNPLKPNNLVLIKGSRGNQMESILKNLLNLNKS